MARLTPDQWQTIRNCWEYDPDSPSHEVAASRAGEKFKFKPPSKSNVHAKCQKDGWERKGNMNGINVAAQRKADVLVDSSGNRTVQNEQNQICGEKQNQVPSPALAQSSREEAEDKRAEVTARHRAEWKNIAVLRQEALAVRNTNPDQSMFKSKLAKINAETTAIQQAGERKAWGLDIQVDMGSMYELSDEQLEAIIRGKVTY
jgi:hypothetical protein